MLRHVFAFAALAAPVAAHADDLERPEQDFLFLIEEAYQQEAGEPQVSTALGVAPEEGVDWTVAFEAEYGLTDRVQVELEVPAAFGDVDGLGDLSVGVGFVVAEEGRLKPQAAIALEATAPTGDADKGLGADAWGYGVSAALSKRAAPWLFLHAQGGYEWVDGAREDEARVDLEEWTIGVGGVAQVARRVQLSLELARGRELEEGQGEREVAYETTAALGLIFDVADVAKIGAAAIHALDGDARDVSGVIKAQVEW